MCEEQARGARANDPNLRSPCAHGFEG